MTEALADRGTALWGVNRFRSDALGSFLDDLVALEEFGLEENLCRAVRAALARITNAAIALLDGSWWKR